MNRKGNGSFMFLLLFILAIAVTNSLGDNNYESYKKECIEQFKNNFSYETTCYHRNLIQLFSDIEASPYECQKINYTQTEEYCLFRYEEVSK